MENQTATNSFLNPKPGSGGFIAPERIVNQLPLAEGARVADFGSGAGYFTILLAQKVGPEGLITALDVLKAALTSIRTKADSLGLKNIDTVRANLEIPGGSGLTDGSQDLVILANILFQSDKKQEIVEEGKRVLKPSGKLVVIEWRHDSGGLGPPSNLRLEQNLAKELALSSGFHFESEIDAGRFHYGLIFSR